MDAEEGTPTYVQTTQHWKIEVSFISGRVRRSRARIKCRGGSKSERRKKWRRKERKKDILTSCVTADHVDVLILLV